MEREYRKWACGEWKDEQISYKQPEDDKGHAGELGILQVADEF